MASSITLKATRPCGFLRPLLAGALLAVAAAGAISAQEANGLISGEVTDADFDTTVPNATVSIEELGLTSKADTSGRFLINAIPPGRYTITVSREGFVTGRFPDQIVNAGAVTRINLQITPLVVELDVYEPPPKAFTETTAIGQLQVKSSAAAIKDILGKEFLSQIGASDAGEAVSKVSGASVADSKYVVIRGLSDRYNVVVLNGAKVPSSDPDKRAVNIDIFPGGLIDNLVIQKTFSPELPGEVTGGYVNVVTKAIPDENFFKVTYGIGYNHQATGNDRWVRNRSGGGVGLLGTSRGRRIPTTLRNSEANAIIISRTTQPADGSSASDLLSVGSVTRGTPPPDFKFAASGGLKGEFMGAPAGIVAAVSYSKKYRYDPNRILQSSIRSNNQPVLQSQYLVEDGREELLAGALVSAGWQPRDNDLVKLTYFGNIAAEDIARYSVGISSPLVDSDSGIEPGEGIISILKGAANGERGSVIEREVSQYVERQLHTLQLSGQHFFDDGEDELNWALAYSKSSQDEPELKITNIIKRLPAGDYRSIDQDFFGEAIDRIWRRIDDSNYFIKADHAMQLIGRQEDEGSARLHFGGSFDQSARDFRADTFAINTRRSSRDFVPAPLNDAADSANLTYSDQLTTFLDSPENLGRGDSLSRVAGTDIYTASQSVLGGFFAAKANVSDTLQTSFGLRVEEYSQYIESEINVLPNSYPVIIREIIANAPNPLQRAQTDFMPQFSARWAPFEHLALSTVMSRTVARPSFKELAPIALREIGDPGQFFVGNPLLESSTIDNYDVKLEWNRPDKAESYAIGAFSKFIDKPIEYRAGPEFNTFANAESGTVWGWELEASKRLEDIPMLQDVTISGNFAQIFSGVELVQDSPDFNARRANGLDTSRRLQGQPDYILNFNAVYNREDIGLFLGLFLNVTGESLAAGGSGFTNAYETDILLRPMTSLDFAIGKDFGENWKLSLRAENLLNTAREERYADGTLRSIGRAGRTYSISLTGEF